MMALTNYVGQTVYGGALMAGISGPHQLCGANPDCTRVVWASGLRDVLTYRHAAVLWLAVCARQIFVSHLWLRRFRYGPLEWGGAGQRMDIARHCSPRPTPHLCYLNAKTVKPIWYAICATAATPTCMLYLCYPLVQGA